jgi:hypothetical protein
MSMTRQIKMSTSIGDLISCCISIEKERRTGRKKTSFYLP